MNSHKGDFAGHSSGSHIVKSNSSHIAKISPIHCDVSVLCVTQSIAATHR